MTATPALDQATLHLDKGSHACEEPGGCLMEYLNPAAAVR